VAFEALMQGDARLGLPGIVGGVVTDPGPIGPAPPPIIVEPSPIPIPTPLPTPTVIPLSP
jgi:hypothetical protein